MPTSYTSLLGLALPVTGELSGTWGDTVNDYITKYVDAAVAGAQTISGSQTAVTLSTTNGSTLSQAGAGATGSAQYAIINCTGNPGGLLTVTAPATSKAYLVINATSTNQSVKIVGSGPTTGVTIAASRAALIAWNGSDFRLIATTDASQLSGILAVANGGTGLSSGTSGGVPYFSATTTMASSAALAANAIVLGGGAGAAPATTTTGTGVVTAIGNAVNTSGGLVTQSGTLAASSLLLGGGASTAISSTTTGTGVVTALGTNVGSAGAFVVNGGALGTPSSGTVTNLTGTASININGTVGATTPNTGAFTSVTATSASGILTRAAATQDGVELIGRAGGTLSYKVSLTPTTLSASRTLTLPDNTGTILTTGATVTVAQGGTGLTSGTSGGIPYFSSTSAMTSSGVLAANALMIGGGAGAAPSTITTGTGVVTALGVNTGTAGAFVVNGGALGTPSSGTLTNATGLPISTGVSGLGTGVATALAVNTGTAGAFVVNGGALGTPSSGTVTNLTGTASININGTVGATTPNTGAFTQVDVDNLRLDANTLSSTNTNGNITIAPNGTGSVVLQQTDAGATAGPILNLYRNSSSPAASDVIGQVLFQGKDSVGNDQTYAYIQSGIEDATSTSEDGNIQFFTTAAGTTAERMRVTAAGDVGIGTNSPSTYGKLAIEKNATGVTTVGVANANAATNDGAKFSSFYASTEIASIGHFWDGSAFTGRLYSYGPLQFSIGSTPTERMRITSAGDVGIGTSSPSAGYRLQAVNSGGQNVIASTSSDASGVTTYMQANGATSGVFGTLTNHPQVFVTNNTERARIDVSGNLLVGATTSPGSPNAQIVAGGTTDPGIQLASTSNGGGLILGAGGGGIGLYTYTGAIGSESYSERARITSGGDLLVGATSNGFVNAWSASLRAASVGDVLINHPNTASSGSAYAQFGYNAGSIGSITQNGTTAVAYNTTSDYRLKENVQPMTGALSRVAALKPCTYTWKVDGSFGEGFIAHEVADVYPQAVSGEKDAVDEDGKIKPQGVDYGKLTPLLTAALQEAMKEIESLKARIAALEAA